MSDFNLEKFRLWQKIPGLMKERAEYLFVQPYKKIEFTGNTLADDLLNDLSEYPHAFVLACVMDRQMKAEKAWMIPYEVSLELKAFDMSTLLSISKDDLTEIFMRKRLHRFNQTMSEYFYLAVHKIAKKYDKGASKIWRDKPKSATVVRKFLEFDGVGIKIATMAANILARDFKIEFQDKICIDISPDVQVMRVFRRLGFIGDNASIEEVIYRAKELNPEYPGIFDLSAWEIGRNWCRPKIEDRRCSDCYLNSYCPKFW